ncbi:zinc-binding alcohol dehydrogenase family protein [Aminobacter sp. UC22_36]|uniref:quinone oxidoreductase family protein n=1 Tax=Aminobacter sp. UC22_36 TaxID=3374549 RepID=UPI003757FEFD
MVQGLTALHLLRESPPQGKSILINAASGGVGTLLIQLAKRAGARQVIAAAGTPGKLDLVSSLGADAGIDYSKPDWPARTRKASGDAGVDIVYDMVGGTMTAAALDALAPGGELVFGAMGRFALDTAHIEAMLAANQSLKGFALLPLLSLELLCSDLGELFQLASTSELKVVLGARFPLDRASDAHRAIEQRRSSGKVVLVP